MMMRLIRDLFPDRVIKLQEGSNMLIHMLLRIDFIKQHMKDEPYAHKDNVLKTVLEVFVQLALLVWELAKKTAFVFAVAWIPWKILAMSCPLIARQQGLTIVYIFFILSTVCGTITNTTIFTMTPDDSFLLNTAGVNAARYYFGRIIYRMVMDAVFGGIALVLAGVGAGQAFMLSVITALFRPVGEVFGLTVYMYLKGIHNKKALYDGVVISVAIIIAYACPYAYRRIAESWNGVTGVPVLVTAAVLAAASLYIIWNYKGYQAIVRELVFTRREDFN